MQKLYHTTHLAMEVEEQFTFHGMLKVYRTLQRGGKRSRSDFFGNFKSTRKKISNSSQKRSSIRKKKDQEGGIALTTAMLLAPLIGGLVPNLLKGVFG